MHTRSVEYKIGGAFVSIVCVGPIERTEINRFINEIRNTFCGIFMQFITPDVIYGIEHLIGVFKITMESKKRNIVGRLIGLLNLGISKKEQNVVNTAKQGTIILPQ